MTLVQFSMQYNLKEFYSGECVYISFYNSPRSELLPKKYNTSLVCLEMPLSLFGFLSYDFRCSLSKELFNIQDKKNVIIEYGGNIFLNIYLLKFLTKSQNIFIDCHNSGVEFQRGHILRFVFSYIYLLMISRSENVKILVHNSSICPKLFDTVVVETPFPEFKLKKQNKKIDFFFQCSLNSDEPIDAIISLCFEFEKLGKVAKISGDIKKIDVRSGRHFFYEKYLSKEQDLSELSKDKVAI